MLRHALVMLSILAATDSAFLELAAAAEQGRGLPPTVGSIERLDPRFDALVPPGAVIETLAMGFAWSEGPVWVASDKGGLPAGCLLFSDIPNNRVHRWQPGKGLDIFMEPAGFTGPAEYGRERGSNGLTLDAAGRLVLCEHGDRRVSRLEPGGGKKTLVDAYHGKRLNSPNDLAIHSSGAIYFTDPPYGLPQGWDDPRRELDFCGVYRLAADGTLTLECDTMTRPNGIAFSHDERILYVNDNRTRQITAFTVQDDGTIHNPRIFVDMTADKAEGNPDGMKVDLVGNMYAAGPGGVWVISPQGKLLGKIVLPERASNMAFGDADGKTLYMTARTSIYRIRLLQAGPLP